MLFLIQKLQERLSIFEKRVYDKQDEDKWRKVLLLEMVSSEESGSGEDDNANYVKELPWRASIVTEFFYDLDEQYAAAKSSQARRQTKQRLPSTTGSSRPAPSDVPAWSLQLD